MTKREINNALDVIFSSFDYIIKNELFMAGDMLFTIENPKTCNVEIALGYLTASLPAKDKFAERKAFANKVRERLVRERSTHEADQLMSGLA